MVARLLLPLLSVCIPYASFAQSIVAPPNLISDLPASDAGPNLVGPQRALWVEQSPGVLTPDYRGTVQLSIAFSGDVPLLRVYYVDGPGYRYDEFPRAETRRVSNTNVDIFRPSWPADEFMRRFGSNIDFDRGQFGVMWFAPSTVPVGSDGRPTQSASYGVRGMSSAIGSVPLVRVDDTAQYSRNVINLVLPGLADSLGPADSFDIVAAARRFYAFLGDDYDNLAFVFREKPFLANDGVAAYHRIVKNDVSGIGLPLSDSSGVYGSSGRLGGTDVFLDTIFNIVSNHELSHQWGHYYDWSTLAGISGGDGSHTPVWGHYESPIPLRGHHAIRIVPQAGNNVWQYQWAPAPVRLPPLLSYTMGRLPAANVPPIQVFDNQAMNYAPGATVTATSRTVTIDQIIAAYGPRTGPAVNALRRATVLISREHLASQREMDYWTFFAQRLEDPNHTGMIDMAGVGSFEALTGVPLQTALVLPAGQTLDGHAVLEPASLPSTDFPGLTIDGGVPLTWPTGRIVRWRGRVDDPAMRATFDHIQVVYGHGVVTPGSNSIFAPIAADGTFDATGALTAPPGRGYLEVHLWSGTATARLVAQVQTVKYTGVPLSGPPAPPFGLQGTALTGRQVSLDWSQGVGPLPQQYRLDVGSTPGTSNIGSLVVGSPPYLLAAPSWWPSGRVWMRVRAENSFGASAPSPDLMIDLAPPPGAPSTPTRVAASVTGRYVTVSWSPAPGSVASRYLIDFGSSPIIADIGSIAYQQSPAIFIVPASAPDGRFYTRVRAENAAGSSRPSDDVGFDIGQPPPPTGSPPSPIGVTVTVNGRDLVIRWLPGAGPLASRFWLDFGSRPGATDIWSTWVNGTVLSFPISAPAVNGRFYVRIRAENALGSSAPSDEAPFDLPSCGTLVPSVLTGTASGSQVALTWTASALAGATYTLVAGSSRGAANIAQAPMGRATSLQATAQVGRYFLRVRTVASCGTSIESNEIQLNVGVPPEPGAPAALASSIAGNTVTLTWQDASGVVDGYLLEAGATPGSAGLASLPLGAIRSYVAVGVPPGTYYVRVRARNAGGPGPPSNEVTVIVR